MNKMGNLIKNAAVWEEDALARCCISDLNVSVCITVPYLQSNLNKSTYVNTQKRKLIKNLSFKKYLKTATQWWKEQTIPQNSRRHLFPGLG